MKGLIAVIRREYLQRVRSRWFLIGTFLAPVFFLALMLFPMLYARAKKDSERTLAVVDETGVLYSRIAPRLEDAGFTVREANSAEEDSLRAEARDGDLGGFLVLGPEALSRGHVVFYGAQGPGAIPGMTIRSVVAQSALEVRLGAVGNEVDLKALLAGGDMDVRLLNKEDGGATENDPKFMGVFVGAMLLYMTILLYAVAVMRATLEEKTGRIVETLISSVRPWQLMLGKILGVGSVGLTQLAVWVLFGVTGLTLGLPALLAARPELADPEFVRQALPSAGLTALFAALFLGGYFLYAALYAAVGAMCSTEEEAQQAQFPIVGLLVVPVMFLMPILEDPNSTGAVIASMIPLFSPILLYARAGAGGVPLWQVLVSLVLLYLGVLGVAWIAGRIYRVGILMQGKRPTLPELWRWVREA